jgi:uncharacterized protein (DUF1499 family)
MFVQVHLDKELRDCREIVVRLCCVVLRVARDWHLRVHAKAMQFDALALGNHACIRVRFAIRLSASTFCVGRRRCRKPRLRPMSSCALSW